MELIFLKPILLFSLRKNPASEAVPCDFLRSIFFDASVCLKSTKMQVVSALVLGSKFIEANLTFLLSKKPASEASPFYFSKSIFFCTPVFKQEQPINIKVVSALVLEWFFFFEGLLTFLIAKKPANRAFSSDISWFICISTLLCIKGILRSKKNRLLNAPNFGAIHFWIIYFVL